MKRVLKKLEPFWEYNPKQIKWPPRENYYEHYALWASLVKPRAYLEIGAMYGWSAMAVLAGWPHIEKMVIVDSELYEIPVTDAMEQILEFRRVNRITSAFDIQAIKQDTTKVDILPIDIWDEKKKMRLFDLIHIDGEHSEKAVRNDLKITLPYLNQNGTIIVDDIRFPEVKIGTDTFLQMHPQLEVRFVDTCQGHYLIWKR